MGLKCLLSIKIFFLFILSSSCSNNDDNFTDKVNVIIDFSVPKQSIKSMSGFLHGVSLDVPEDSLISLLEPKLFRIGTRYQDAYSRKSKAGAKQILMISDMWATGPGNYFRVMPFDNYELYKKFLNDLLDQVGNNVIFDVWNEPNVGHLWVGTPQQFYKFFKITHDIIRERFGKDAIISGPSANLLPKYIDEFMHFCDTANIQLDIFSYHDLDERDYDNVAKTIRYFRGKYANNPKYAHVGIKQIHVNEYGYNGSLQNPSMVLGYLFNLEQGGADGACRACWNTSDNISTCFNGSLGGALTKEHKPTSAWWAYKLYAESTKNRVQSIATAPFMANFAYLLPSKHPKARVVIANASRNIYVRELNVSLKNLSSLPFISNRSETVNVKIYEVPDTGEEALDNIVLKQENSYKIGKGSVTIFFNDINPLANYMLEIGED